MQVQEFTAAYNEGRNGANYFVRHWFRPSFQFSDGVEQVAAAGCFWLLDILATEAADALRKSGEYMGFIEVDVAENKALITMTVDDDKPPVFSRHLEFTDMPDGKWKFFLADEVERFALILPTEY